MAVITLKKVEVIGEKYFHTFKMDDDSIQEVETTEADYKQLGQKEPTNPTIDGGVWESSVSVLKYDTPDGDLHDGEYCKDGGKNILMDNGLFIIASDEELVNDKIDSAVISAAVSKLQVENLIK